jgi:hypothetical protein
MTMGLGLYSTLDRNSGIGEWIGFEVSAGLSAGMVGRTLLPAFQAGLEERDQVTATAR